MSVMQTLSTKTLLLTRYLDEPLSYYAEKFINLQRYVLRLIWLIILSNRIF